MKQRFWDRRIPSLLGLLMIGVGIAMASFFGRQVTNLFLRAAPSFVPTTIRITNVTDSAFTVTYMTESNVIGSIVLENQAANGGTQRVILDDRDQASGTPTQHQMHSITIRDLEPKTQYTFSINSGSTNYLDGNKPFTITTGETIATLSKSANPVIGKIVMPAGENASEAIVYLTVPGGQTLSSLIKDTGTYILPLTGMRTSDLKSFVELDDKTVLQILVSGNELSSKVFVTLSNANPVPLITLSNDYDFTVNSSPLASTSAQALQFPEFPIDSSIKASPKIQTPTNNESFTDNQPVLRGQAIPNTIVNITIHSDEKLTTTVVSDSNGNWSYRPVHQLSPGEHTITITTKDQFGVLQTIQKAFTIFQSGTTVAEAATPSAKLAGPTNTPTPSPKPSATPTPNVASPTPTPSLVSPTPASNAVSPTPTQLVLSPTKTPTTKGGLLPTGNNSLIVGTAAGIVTTIVGTALFFFTRGAGL